MIVVVRGHREELAVNDERASPGTGARLRVSCQRSFLTGGASGPNARELCGPSGGHNVLLHPVRQWRDPNVREVHRLVRGGSATTSIMSPPALRSRPSACVASPGSATTRSRCSQLMRPTPKRSLNVTRRFSSSSSARGTSSRPRKRSARSHVRLKQACSPKPTRRPILIQPSGERLSSRDQGPSVDSCTSSVTTELTGRR